MPALNLKHLRYFWTVARAGGITRAAALLHVTPQSISGQLRELEHALGVALLRRAGRGLEVTDVGRRIAGYAEQIFALEAELLGVVRDPGAAVAEPFRIGIADSVPKSLAYRVLRPALRMPESVRLVCKEGRLVSLLADLAAHRLDMVIADRPMPTDIRVRAYDHLLGSSDVTIFGTASLARTLAGAFPQLLDGAPFLLPGDGVAIRPGLEQWFEAQRVRPLIVGEFDDSALLKAFGQGGAGLFAAPTAIADYVCTRYGVTALGRIDSVVEYLYAISPERKLRHPVTMAVSQAAAREVFALAPSRTPTSISGPPTRSRRTHRGASARGSTRG